MYLKRYIFYDIDAIYISCFIVTHVTTKLQLNITAGYGNSWQKHVKTSHQYSVDNMSDTDGNFSDFVTALQPLTHHGTTLRQRMGTLTKFLLCSSHWKVHANLSRNQPGYWKPRPGWQPMHYSQDMS
jgi:PhoPQ-activated pathogenicity-related protein